MKISFLFVLFLVFAQAFSSNTIDWLEESTDLVVLKDVTAVKFFFLADVPREEMHSLNQIAMQSLEKIGKVSPKSINIQNPLEDLDDSDGFF